MMCATMPLFQGARGEQALGRELVPTECVRRGAVLEHCEALGGGRYEGASS